jgi:hypothetical protein
MISMPLSGGMMTLMMTSLMYDCSTNINDSVQETIAVCDLSETIEGS